MIFTTSWDDGDALDRRIADMLDRFGCTGTFYVLPDRGLTESDVRELSARHEIGAHSLTHPRLTRLPPEEARREIDGSKRWVEETTGKPCMMFCYPKGDENPSVRALVRDAGFRGARTTEAWKFDVADPFAIPTSLRVMPFPWRKSRNIFFRIADPLGPLRASLGSLRELHIPFSACGSWLSLARALFARALKTGQPFFHLWGHSNEIERYGMWKDLGKFLNFVQEHPGGVLRVPNSGLIPLHAAGEKRYAPLP